MTDKGMSAAAEGFSILVFTRAVGFVHLSIPDAVVAIETLGAEHGFTVDATDDATHFTDADLARYAALVFVHTTGNVLSEPGQRTALENYIHKGGGFFGVHAASAMGTQVVNEWPFYRDLVGASFKGHTAAHVYADEPMEVPGVTLTGPLSDAPADAEDVGPAIRVVSWERAVVNVEDMSSPAMRGMREQMVRSDEWYGFHENPRPQVHVLATVDESTYDPFTGGMGPDHPIAWWRPFQGGRSIYNAMGHAEATWREEAFRESILGGIQMAAGVTS
jgi:type 1 glutamine amidotransferase